MTCKIEQENIELKKQVKKLEQEKAELVKQIREKLIGE